MLNSTIEDKLIYILNRLKHKPFIIKYDCGITLVWNTTKHYIDIEISEKCVSVCISKDRKHMEFFEFHD